MKKDFYYDCMDGRFYLTLTKASRQWVNYDCPTLSYRDGSMVLNCTIYGWNFNGYDVIALEKIRTFIDKSERAFIKWMANQYSEYAKREKEHNYNLLKNFDKSIR